MSGENYTPEQMNQAYREGFLAGLEAYAWWKDGVQYVGSTGVTLRQAKGKAEDCWNYSPPCGD